MIYTEMIQKAVEFAIRTHWVDEHQFRKGKDIPYISHPLTVALILPKAGADDDTIAAGILHDSIEDASPSRPVTMEILSNEFNDRVASLVKDVTEPDINLPWELRKKEAENHVATFSKAAILVKSADLIAKDLELLADYHQHGDSVFERFSLPGTEQHKRAKVVGHKLKLNQLLRERWPKSPLDEDLRALHAAMTSLLEG